MTTRKYIWLQISKMISALLIFAMLAGLLLMPAPDSCAASITVKGKLVSQTSVKLTLSKRSGISHWRIRRAADKADGSQTEYKTIKTLSKNTRTYTMKNLKKNTQYRFEIIGCTKKKGKYKGVIYEYLSIYTGLSNVVWNDYAYSDAPCSPESIELWGESYDDGLPVSGYEVYRKQKGGKYSKIASFNKKGFPYVDKNVKKGESYYYRFRAYGTYNRKKIYSSYSDSLLRSAVNQSGTFKTKLISRSEDELVIKVKSAKYNGKLVLDQYDSFTLAEDYTSFEYDEGGAVVSIAATSTDGKTWVDTPKKFKITLDAGQTIYLRFKGNNSDTSLLDGKLIGSQEVRYNRLPSILTLSWEGDTGSSAWMNGELIH